MAYKLENVKYDNESNGSYQIVHDTETIGRVFKDGNKWTWQEADTHIEGSGFATRQEATLHLLARLQRENETRQFTDGPTVQFTLTGTVAFHDGWDDPVHPEDAVRQHLVWYLSDDADYMVNQRTAEELVTITEAELTTSMGKETKVDSYETIRQQYDTLTEALQNAALKEGDRLAKEWDVTVLVDDILGDDYPAIIVQAFGAQGQKSNEDLIIDDFTDIANDLQRTVLGGKAFGDDVDVVVFPRGVNVSDEPAEQADDLVGQLLDVFRNAGFVVEKADH